MSLAYAGFGRRLGAHAIDCLIYVPAALAVLITVYGQDYFNPAEPRVIQGFWDVMINHLLPLLLVVVLWRRFGATPGKQLLHCRVVDARSGGPLTWSQAALRYVAYLASMLPLFLGFLWILWDRRRQGFHDKIAGTVVIYAPEDESTKSLEQLIRESR